MFLESYQFEAQVQLKIRNENTYKKAEAGKVIDFLENKTLVDTSELQLLRLKREELDVWESKKSWPAYDSGSNKVIMHSTATTWIIYLPVATHRYVVVKVQQDEDVP